MALVIGKAFDFNNVQAILDRQERVVLSTGRDAPLTRMENASFAPTVSQFSNYYLGQYGTAFELHHGATTTTPPTASPLAPATPALIAATPALVTMSPPTLVNNTLTVATNLTALSATITSALTVPQASMSNVTVRTLPAVTQASIVPFFRIDVGADLPVLTAYNDRSIVMPTSGRFGIGTDPAIGEQFHITGRAVIETKLNVKEIETYAIYGSNTASNHGLIFFPSCNVVQGNTAIFGNLHVQGAFEFERNIEFADVVAGSNLLARRAMISNVAAQDYSTLHITHVVPSYCNNGVLPVFSCNTEPIIIVDVEVKAINDKYRVLTMDPYGRVGMGTTAPRHFLSLEASDLNKDLIGEGLIMARNTMDNSDDVFVVDRHARIGIGTTAPRHHLDIDISDTAFYNNPTIAVYHSTPCNIGSFAAFRSNADVVWEVQNGGRMLVGMGASNLALASTAWADAVPPALVVAGDIMTDRSLIVSSIGPYGGAGASIDVLESTLSNIGMLNASRAFVTDLSACNVFAGDLVADTLNIPGLTVTEATKIFNANLDNFVFSGAFALFSSNAGNALPANLTQEGKVKIAIPNALAPTATNKVLVLEAPAPVLTVRSTTTGTSASTLEFVNTFNGFTGALAFNNNANGFAFRAKATESSGLSDAMTINMSKVDLLSSAGALTVQTTATATATGINLGTGTAPSILEGLHVRGDLLLDAGIAGSGNLTVARLAQMANLVATGVCTFNSNVDVLGQLYARNSILQSSDSNLKTSIRIITDPLDKVMAMAGYTYERVGMVDREMGLIAQEVAAVVPEVVRTGEDGNLAVAYGNLAGLFVEAIKTLTAKVDSLTAEVAYLRGTVGV